MTPSILIIDDDEDSVDLMRRRLQPEFRVLTAGSGAEGRARAVAEHPDLIVCDVILPDADGFQLAAALKADPATKDTPLIVVSALYVPEGDWRSGVEIGGRQYRLHADAFVSKPVRWRSFLDTARSLLKGQPEQPAGPEQERILVVDDNEETVNFLQYKLRKEYEVETAGDGKDGLSKVEVFSPNLILLDFMMPGLDGLEMIRRVRERDANVAIIIMTAYGSEEVAVEAMKRGADDYFSKPFDFERVKVKIRENLEKNRLKVERETMLAQLRSTSRDLLERNRLLEERTAELEELARFKDKYLGFLVHEFRTPISIIMEGSDAILEGIFKADDVGKIIQMINNNGRELLRLANEILALAKMKEGRVDLQLDEQVDLAEVAGKALDNMRLLADAHKLTIRLDTAEGLPAIRADSRKLNDILYNLLSNAIKFTEEGGVTVSLQASAGGDTVCLSVEDTGCGIPPEELPLIFQEFHRAAQARTHRAAGTGLGLAVVRLLAEAHGGKAGVESEPGKGSRFYVELPVGGPPPKPPAGVAGVRP